MVFAPKSISNINNNSFRFYEQQPEEQVSAASLWSAIPDFGSTQIYSSPTLMDPTKRFELIMNYLQTLPQDFATFSMNMHDYKKGFTPFGDFSKYICAKTDLTAFKTNYNSKLGERFAKIAYNNAREINSSGKCAKGVRTALEKTGISDGFQVASAKDADTLLNNHKDFKKVDVNYNDLKKLPAGCIIVWEASEGHQHGHIAVTLGNGQEASDKIRSIVRREGVKYTVYMPT